MPMSVSYAADLYYPRCRDIRRKIHRYPELAFNEKKTTEIILSELRASGIEASPFACNTGVFAYIRAENADETVYLREDIDALPILEKTGLDFESEKKGICHACGHDIHTAALLLTAFILNENRDSLKSNVRLIFQPAEELLNGAKAIIESDVRETVKTGDVIIGFHVSPEYPPHSVILKKGPYNASSDKVTIKVRGKGGHGAHPEQTADPITASAYMITQMQTAISREICPVSPAVLSFCSVRGGQTHNVIPEEVIITGSLRTLDEAVRAKLKDAIVRIAEGIGKANNVQATVTIEEQVPVLMNDNSIIDRIENAAKKEPSVGEIYRLDDPSLGSDDFASYLSLMRGAQFLVGASSENSPDGAGLHSPNVIFDEEAIRTGALVMSRLVLDQS